MKHYLDGLLKNNKLIPNQICEYMYSGSIDPGDGSLQLTYISESNGFFTITIYNGSSEPIHDDLDSIQLTDEFNQCIDVMYELEQLNLYVNVQQIAKDYYSDKVSGKNLFHSCIFQYSGVNEDGSISDPHFSFLFLRSDYGCFHKIRFSMDEEFSEITLDKMDQFLMEWLEFIKCIAQFN